MFRKLFGRKKRVEKKEKDELQVRQTTLEPSESLILRDTSPPTRPKVFHIRWEIHQKEFAGIEIAPEDIIYEKPIGLNSETNRGKGQQSNVYKGLYHGNEVCVKGIQVWNLQR